MGARILVVDDDRTVQETFMDLLREAGHDVEGCRDGNKVIPLLEQNPFDLVLLDVLIPHVNGFTLVQQIRSHPLLGKLKIILVSGIYRSRNHRADMLRKHDVVEYLDKPVSSGVLLELVDRCLSGAPTSAVDTSEPQAESTKEHGSTKEPSRRTLIRASAQSEQRAVERASRSDFRTTVLAFQGKVTEHRVPKLLGRLWREGQSGGLLLRRDKVKKIIYVREGSVYEVKSNLVGECLGQILLKERLISESELAESIARMKKTGKKQGEVLVEMRSMTEKNLAFALELQLEAKLFDAFRWEGGEFRFNKAIALPPSNISLGWTGGSLIVEGIRRTFDAERVRAALAADMNVPLELTEPLVDPESLGLSQKEQLAVQRLPLPASPKELLRSVELAPNDTLRLLFTLRALRLLERADP